MRLDRISRTSGKYPHTALFIVIFLPADDQLAAQLGIILLASACSYYYDTTVCTMQIESPSSYSAAINATLVVLKYQPEIPNFFVDKLKYLIFERTGSLESCFEFCWWFFGLLK